MKIEAKRACPSNFSDFRDILRLRWSSHEKGRISRGNQNPSAPFRKSSCCARVRSLLLHKRADSETLPQFDEGVRRPQKGRVRLNDFPACRTRCFKPGNAAHMHIVKLPGMVEEAKNNNTATLGEDVKVGAAPTSW
jgi:hypothetical protein